MESAILERANECMLCGHPVGLPSPDSNFCDDQHVELVAPDPNEITESDIDMVGARERAAYDLDDLFNCLICGDTGEIERQVDVDHFVPEACECGQAPEPDWGSMWEAREEARSMRYADRDEW